MEKSSGKKTYYSISDEQNSNGNQEKAPAQNYPHISSVIRDQENEH